MSYEAIVLADSVSPCGSRLTTIQVRFPRIILAEMNTHRKLSRLGQSSRAKPVEHQIAAVRQDPFVPEAFGRNQRGMRAGTALEREEQARARVAWLDAAQDACDRAERLARLGVHKQWANRLIEPFAWHTGIFQSTDWSNFFHLRISEHAQPEARRTAEAMKAAMDASSPTSLLVGEWHLPLVRDEDRAEVFGVATSADGWITLAKLSAARCARVSYLTHDGRRDLSADLSLHDRLLADGHMSPFEFPAFVGGDDWWNGRHGQPYGNLDAPWIQLRKTIPREADRMAPEA